MRPYAQVGSVVENEPLKNKAKVSYWAKGIGLCSVLQLFFGIAIFSFGVRFYATYSIVVGSLYIFTSLIGVLVSWKQKKNFAKMFFYLYSFVILCCTVASLIDISSTATWLNYYCSEYHLNNQECSNMRLMKWICSVSVFLVSIITGCVTVFFISALHDALDTLESNEDVGNGPGDLIGVQQRELLINGI